MFLSKLTWLMWLQFGNSLSWKYTTLHIVHMVHLYFIIISRARHDFRVCCSLRLPLESVKTALAVSHSKQPMVLCTLVPHIMPGWIGSWLGRKLAIMNQHWLAWKLLESFCSVLDCNSLLAQFACQFFSLFSVSLLMAWYFHWKLKCN